MDGFFCVDDEQLVFRYEDINMYSPELREIINIICGGNPPGVSIKEDNS